MSTIALTYRLDNQLRLTSFTLCDSHGQTVDGFNTTSDRFVLVSRLADDRESEVSAQSFTLPTAYLLALEILGALPPGSCPADSFPDAGRQF